MKTDDAEDQDGLDFLEGGRRPSKRWADDLSWYLLVLGFIAIVVAGLCFFLFRNHPLTYADFSIDANTLGKYLMILGLVSYIAGRAIYYSRKLKRRKEDS